MARPGLVYDGSGLWGRGPTPGDLERVAPEDPCPAVDHAARDMYDHSYQGTGDRPFGVACAGRYGLAGFVTRPRSLDEGVRRVYPRASFEEVWLRGTGSGGLVHIVRPPVFPLPDSEGNW
ncbi:hypothetical protein ACFHYQ_25450 [Sphaerimonospora cavernae]|uniref:Uncharacterized protein n=1 Tax=Sphaerimonospora cavernae TaxID=1740611 RepID=A0ABV6UBR4_9ACTN